MLHCLSPSYKSDRPLWGPRCTKVTWISRVQEEFAAYQTSRDGTCDGCRMQHKVRKWYSRRSNQSWVDWPVHSRDYTNRSDSCSTRVAQKELASLQRPWLIMYFTKQFQNLLPRKNLFNVITLFTLDLFRLNIYDQVHIWHLRLSLCSHSLVYLTSFVDVWDLSCLVFISAEEKKDSGVLGIILHPGATCRLCCWLNMAVVLSLLTSCRFILIRNISLIYTFWNYESLLWLLGWK